MRRSLLISSFTAAALVAGSSAAAQIAPAGETVRVAETSRWAEGVERQKTRLRRTDVKLPSQITQNGLLRVYVRDDSIRKLEATFYADTGRSTHHYYVDGDQLRLAILRESQYDRPRSERVVAQRVEYFWFDGDSLLYWLDRDNRGMTAESTEGRQRGTDVQQSFRELLALRRARR